MAVLVFGASSQIGHFLLPRLLASGEPVLAISRVPRASSAELTWLQGALPDRVPDVPVLSAVLCCGPLPGLAAWLERTPLQHSPRIVALSSMSAEAKRASSVAAERELAQQLLAGEAALARACDRARYAWTVLRPTLVYGAGLDRSLTPLAQRAARTRIFLLPAGTGLRQPVHADDLAQAMLAALECPAAAGRVLSIGGGERLSARDMLARVRRSVPCRSVPLPLPRWLLRCAGGVLPRWRGPLARLQLDQVADNTEMQQLLGIQPRPFQPDAATWGLPS